MPHGRRLRGRLPRDTDDVDANGTNLATLLQMTRDAEEALTLLCADALRWGDSGAVGDGRFHLDNHMRVRAAVEANEIDLAVRRAEISRDNAKADRLEISRRRSFALSTGSMGSWSIVGAPSEQAGQRSRDPRRHLPVYPEAFVGDMHEPAPDVLDR